MSHYRKGFASRILDQLTSHPSIFDSIQELMDFALELDTRYHERQKEKNNFQEKKSEFSKYSSSHTQHSSSSSLKRKNLMVHKRDKPHYSLLNKDQKLMAYEKERRFKEGLCSYCGGKHNIEDCVKRPQKQLTQLEC
ncbi:hypothetical protein O181_010484 [Austropuccinia psidii MF-1]|uniref:Uncharacterized protein n=1 Tax=Austropuccinia psidii MF-1 TaxID=1389203 RepID=A0A9Q3GKW5_9BASI|nr:hypothetical protein [Austropuccinia psidii MF-1]